MKAKTKRLWFALAAMAVFLAGGVAVVMARPFTANQKLIPSIHALRGDLEIVVVTQGELRTPHSMAMVAPQVNGTLQIVSMLSTGAHVKAGDIIAEFDPSEQEYNLELSESQLKQADQDIIKAKADTDVQTAVDQAALIKARFDVRLAELE